MKYGATFTQFKNEGHEIIKKYYGQISDDKMEFFYNMCAGIEDKLYQAELT